MGTLDRVGESLFEDTCMHQPPLRVEWAAVCKFSSELVDPASTPLKASAPEGERLTTPGPGRA